MTYNDLNVGMSYSFWDNNYYLIVNKGIDEFEYYNYNSYDKIWTHKFYILSNDNLIFKNWKNLETNLLRKSIKTSMIKNLFRNGINNG